MFCDDIERSGEYAKSCLGCLNKATYQSEAIDVFEYKYRVTPDGAAAYDDMICTLDCMDYDMFNQFPISTRVCECDVDQYKDPTTF